MDHERLFFGGPKVSAFRLHRHHLDRPAPRDQISAVVGDTCGVQTQVTVMSRTALWARLEGLTLEDVEKALQQKRTIVKTWSMRGALHLHRSSELLVVLGGLMATRLRHHQRWIHRTGLREEETTRMVLTALEDGSLTRSQLVDRLSRKFGARSRNWTDGGWGVKKEGSSLLWYLVQPAMTRGLVCFGSSGGQEATFVRTDQWLRTRQRMPSEVEAENALVRRYLHSFGPADANDFRAWSGNHLRRIRVVLERLRDELVEVEADGHRGYLLRKDLSDFGSTEIDRGVVRLLPSFDPFLLGHHDRAHLVDQARYHEVYKDAGWLAPVVLVDGRVAGTWSYQRQPRRFRVEVKMFRAFSNEMRTKVEEQARDLSRFLEISGVAIAFIR
jgi:winged helix DNA-binding protein